MNCTIVGGYCNLRCLDGKIDASLCVAVATASVVVRCGESLSRILRILERLVRTSHERGMLDIPTRNESGDCSVSTPS